MKFASLSLAVALSLAGATAANAATLGRSASVQQVTAPSAACPTGPGTLSYNTDCAPTLNLTIACGGTNLVTTAENSYYRRYVFPAGTPANASVTAVRYAVQAATSTAVATITGPEIRLYSIPTGTALTTAALTPIGSAALSVPVGTSVAEFTAAIAPAAVVDTPTSKDIVVELFQPDLTATPASFIYGSNGTGTGITYLRAPSCGAAQPVDIASLGAFSGIKIIASLTGTGLPVELQEYSVD